MKTLVPDEKELTTGAVIEVPLGIATMAVFSTVPFVVSRRVILSPTEKPVVDNTGIDVAPADTEDEVVVEVVLCRESVFPKKET